MPDIGPDGSVDAGAVELQGQVVADTISGTLIRQTMFADFEHRAHVAAAAGEPPWLYRYVPHPVVAVGRAVAWGERRLFRPGAPLPMCEVEVIPCYGSREDELGCRNPEFHELPRERAGFRVFARVSDAS